MRIEAEPKAGRKHPVSQQGEVETKKMAGTRRSASLEQEDAGGRSKRTGMGEARDWLGRDQRPERHRSLVNSRR